MTHKEIQERNKLVVIDYKEGMNRIDIRKKYNITNGVISFAVKGIYRKRTDFLSGSKLNKDELISLYNEGLNHQQIGEKLGFSPRYIADRLKSYGLKPHKIKRGRQVQTTIRKTTFIREELPPRLEALREKYKMMKIDCEAFTNTRISQYDFEYNVQPKRF